MRCFDNLCDVEPGARRSSCHFRPHRLQSDPRPSRRSISSSRAPAYDTPVDAYCGTLKVYENRATKQGRQIDLNIVVLPALRADAQPDPLFFLAGGPGQGAAKLAKVVREIFRRVQTDRDIVLVDQRGTGKSNPLNCDERRRFAARRSCETDEQTLDRTQACLAELRRRPHALHDRRSRWTISTTCAPSSATTRSTSTAARTARAPALVYLRQHGDHVRAAILDGVAPTEHAAAAVTSRATRSAPSSCSPRTARATTAASKAYPNLAERMQRAGRAAREESADGAA